MPLNKIFIFLFLSILFCTLPFAGCKQNKNKTDKTSASEQKEPSETSSKEEDMRFRGEAFGLPLPPRVRNLRRFKGYIVAETDLNILELEKFFKETFKEFEVIRVGRTLRAVGLREYMPEVRAAYIRGLRSNMRVVYYPARQRPDGAGSKDEPRLSYKERTKRDFDRVVKAKPKKGSPVTLKNRKGELVAPGAKWGEPYFPPKGTPLHTKATKHNWGLPFGEWTPE